ncbi:MAG: electron transfer flavoprotein subunit alpha/FixB family protein [Candidatus Bathyarchaeota archaeon]|nr:MAG: electron transfer flavoprotein subunit alpha/FixB family protein [Candidatus Bathyarchaeota archaeon]
MNDHKGVWVFSENYELMLELLAGGRPLAASLKTELAAILMGSQLNDRATELVRHGADKVYSMDNPDLKDCHTERCLSLLAKLAIEHKPEIILIGSTKSGKELASRLAARLETGCTPDCVQLDINGQGTLTTKRVVYSGNAVVTATYLKKPQIAAVLPRAFEKPEPTERKGHVVTVDVKIEKSAVEIVEINEIRAAEVKIEEAKIVICGGRGIDKKEDFQPLIELANLLGGQVGNTRPLAEDRKWFTEWIGLSGKKIRPALYMGCGISGMIQHVAGMRDSQVVVAINKDPEAAIFEVADYVVVGNLYEIVPAIAEQLRKQLS